VKFPRRRFLYLASGILASPSSRASPLRNPILASITLIVPYPPAGRPTRSRGLSPSACAPRLAAIVIENVSGGGGTIASPVWRARSAWLHAEHRALGLACRQRRVYTLPFDLLTDLEPVALIADGRSSSSPRNPSRSGHRQLTAWLKANPGKGMVGTTGVGGASASRAGHPCLPRTTGPHPDRAYSRLAPAHAGLL